MPLSDSDEQRVYSDRLWGLTSNSGWNRHLHQGNEGFIPWSLSLGDKMDQGIQSEAAEERLRGNSEWKSQRRMMP